VEAWKEGRAGKQKTGKRRGREKGMEKGEGQEMAIKARKWDREGGERERK